MSVELVNLSHKQKSLTAPEHSILNVLAYRANDDHECWPSVASLRESTSLDRKTILKSLANLIEKNLIHKTGQMMGKTKSTPVYKVNLSSPKNGTASKISSPNFSDSSPKNGTSKQSQIWDMERSFLKDKRKGLFSLLKPETHSEKQAINYLMTTNESSITNDDCEVLSDLINKYINRKS